MAKKKPKSEERAQYKRTIPLNSVNIIIKFRSNKELQDFIRDPEFHKRYGALDSYAISKNAETRHFTYP